MSEKAKNRIEWLDCAKGFAIILVVYGHALTYFSPNFDNVVHVIYSFHMPLFFVLTGYVSAYSYNSVNFNTFSKKKINALMKPYLWYGVVLFAFKFLRNFLSDSNAIGGGYASCIVNTLLITRKSFISELWFLPCLLIAHCLMFFIIRRKTICSWIIATLCFVVALLARLTYNIALPYDLDNALLAIPFILGGVRLRMATKQQRNKINKVCVLLVALIVFGCANFIGIFYGYSIDYFADIIIGNAFLFLLTSVSGTIIIVLCAQAVSNYENSLLKKYLMKCGKNSLSIYGAHYIVLAVVYQLLKHFRRENLVWQQLLIIAEVGIVVALILLSKERFNSWKEYRSKNK